MSQDLLELSGPPADAARRRGWHGPRLRIAACLAVIVLALGWITIRGLTGNFVYYLTPTEAVTQHQAVPGHRIRLGGYVVPGSVHHAARDLTFVVTDGSTAMGVVSTAPVPELFRAGQGVVLEGSVADDGRFHADTLLVKHDGTYRPPSGAVPGDLRSVTTTSAVSGSTP